MESNVESILGIIPHSIRGFLHSFEQILPATEKYTNCVACSEMILNEFEKSGIEFLLKAFNNSKYLEDVALLTELFKDSNFSEVSLCCSETTLNLMIFPHPSRNHCK